MHAGSYGAGIDHIADIARADRVEDLSRALRDLLERSRLDDHFFRIDNLLEAHLIYLREHLPQTDTSTENFAIYYAHVLNIQISVYEQTGFEPQLIHVNVKPVTLKLKLLKLIGIKKLCQLIKLLHKIKPASR